jgi:hypothetical protein
MQRLHTVPGMDMRTSDGTVPEMMLRERRTHTVKASRGQ